MKIAILGTRGIPNNYGGFEQFAEYLSLGLTERGHDVYVYNSHNHVYQQSSWKNVNIIHCYDPEYRIGTAGQFIYDFNCILDSRKRKYDIIFQLGYTSSSVFSFLMPLRSIIVTNMDGLEWKRTKYGKATQSFLKYAEALAVKKSDYLIADSLGIKKYLNDIYQADSEYIPYGAHVFNNPSPNVLVTYSVKPYAYDMLMARLEPENSIEMILDGVAGAITDRDFLVIGNHNTAFGKYLVEKFKIVNKIKFLGGIYDLESVNNLRYYSNLYFHGHTVGGTNPSLLEAMASNALIAAHNNNFNASILGTDAYYFTNSEEVTHIVSGIRKDASQQEIINANRKKIEDLYTWKNICDQHEALFENILSIGKKK